ncbi:19058_t:CDS:2 [Gigaspora rosea]|nr:19058_t:CDS:2 [Gigaspora rosea]
MSLSINKYYDVAVDLKSQVKESRRYQEFLLTKFGDMQMAISDGLLLQMQPGRYF